MSDSLSEHGKRLRESTQALINAGGDPSTAVVREMNRGFKSSKIGDTIAKITEITDEGVNTEEDGFFSWDDLVNNHYTIYMHLKKG